MRLWSGGDSLTVRFTNEAVAAWHAPATGERGGQPIHSTSRSKPDWHFV
jgi:hypothetical protein